MKYQELSREEVRNVIRGKGSASRVPINLKFWTHPAAFKERQGEVDSIMGEYPEDILTYTLNMPQIYKAPADAPDYRWLDWDMPANEAATQAKAGHDTRIALPDWEQLDRIIEKFPDPYYQRLIPQNSVEDNRYILSRFFFCFFERHWMLRGMDNALTDYYLYPDEVHRLFRSLTDFYKVVIIRSKKELQADGFLTSDDLGTQTGVFFSEKIFDTFFIPYYRELIDTAHSMDMDFWLHSCGCVDRFIPKFIDIGLDVLHPIQKYTMDETEIARKYGGEICFWAGFDVQRIIPWGTPEEVRREVRFMMDNYYRKDGRFIFTAGNGINGDCPTESLKALYDEAFKYGIEVVNKNNMKG